MIAHACFKQTKKQEKGMSERGGKQKGTKKGGKKEREFDPYTIFTNTLRD